MTKRDKIRDFLKINDALDPARNHHIDALKGFAIIAVVFVHAIQVNDPHHDSNRVYLALISWAMPLFMLLSGFILSTQFGYSVPRYLKKNFLRLLVPFFVWALVNYVLYNSSQSVHIFGASSSRREKDCGFYGCFFLTAPFFSLLSRWFESKTGCVGRIISLLRRLLWPEQHRQIYLVYQNAGYISPIMRRGFSRTSTMTF